MERLTLGGGHVPDHHEGTARHHRGRPLQAGGSRRRRRSRVGGGLVAGAWWRGDEEEEEEEGEERTEVREGRRLHVVDAGQGCSSS